MKVAKALPLLLAIFAAAVPVNAVEASAQTTTYTIHGSGTTNPSKCLWHIMSLFQDRSRASTRLTYRAVGSSTGQMEFIGRANNFVPHNIFGAGDIPIKQGDYEDLNAAFPYGTDSNEPAMVHLPFAISSVSFFVNIPGIKNGKDGLKLDACTVAKIFSGKIGHWDHPDIIALNPSLKDQLTSGDKSLPIYVSRRVNGSSSTSSVTNYLNMQCPSEWPNQKTGSKLSATVWGDHTNECYGSSGMTKCINGHSGAIGYMDSGHGWSENIVEIRLKNAAGFFLSSREAHTNKGIVAAVQNTETKQNAFDDWSAVNFLNKDGTYTWPLVVMSYIYVRRDITGIMANAENRGLFKAFLEALYKEEYFGKCTALGFTEIPDDVKDMATKGIEAIGWDFPINNGDEKNMWSFEDDVTQQITGMGEFVISSKRKSLTGMSISEIAGEETELEKDVAFLSDSFHRIVEGLHEDFIDNNQDKLNTEPTESEDNSSQVKAALVLSALSFTLWMCVIVGFFIKKCVLRL